MGILGQIRRGPRQLREQQDWEGWRPSTEELLSADVVQLRRWGEEAGRFRSRWRDRSAQSGPSSGASGSSKQWPTEGPSTPVQSSSHRLDSRGPSRREEV
eukprot:3133779-Pyramimonas_sp.AAC.1